MDNMIPLLQIKTADKHIWKFLQVWPGPFHNFWAGLGDEATIYVNDRNKQIQKLEFENENWILNYS